MEFFLRYIGKKIKLLIITVVIFLTDGVVNSLVTGLVMEMDLSDLRGCYACYVGSFVSLTL